LAGSWLEMASMANYGGVGRLNGGLDRGALLARFELLRTRSSQASQPGTLDRS